MQRVSMLPTISDFETRLLMPALLVYKEVVLPEFAERGADPLGEVATGELLDKLVANIAQYMSICDLWVHPKLLYEGLVLCNIASVEAVETIPDSMPFMLVFVMISSFLMIMREEFI